jgi:protein CpxP
LVLKAEEIMMKRHLCSLALTGLLAAGVLYAQEPASPPPDGGMAQQGSDQGMGGRRGGRGMDPDKTLDHMTKRYNLTSDQQNQIRPILQDQQQQMQSLRGDTSMSREDKMAKMRSMHQASQQKIEAVLTDDQRKKFDADQKKMEERRAEHMGGGQGGPGEGGPPPPPQQ